MRSHLVAWPGHAAWVRAASPEAAAEEALLRAFPGTRPAMAPSSVVVAPEGGASVELWVDEWVDAMSGIKFLKEAALC